MEVAMKRKAALMDHSGNDGAHSAAKSRKDSGSGGGLSAAKCTIVFADTGKVHPYLEGKMIYDPRIPVSISEVDVVAREYNADVVARVEELAKNGPVWKVSWTEDWECTNIGEIELQREIPVTARHVLLRRTHLPWSEEIGLILVRIVKGKAATPFLFSDNARKHSLPNVVRLPGRILEVKNSRQRRSHLAARKPVTFATAV